MPEHAATLAPAYGYLLLLQGEDYFARSGCCNGRWSLALIPTRRP